MRVPDHMKDFADRLVAAPVEIKLANTTGEVTGYASVYDLRDRHGDIVLAGAFAQTLREHQKNSTRPLMLWQHDPDRIIGAWESFAEDAKGLKVAGRLNLETQAGREAHALLKQGALNGLSIGYRVLPGGAEIDRKGVRRLKAIELFEVSFVGMPSNGAARIDGIKMDRRSDFELFLKSAGFPNGAARKLSSGGWPALAGQQDDEQEAADLLAAIKSATAELSAKGARK